MRFWLQKVFLSTPSARRATLAACAALHADAISIHALREEGDSSPFFKGKIAVLISIHALREEGDVVIRMIAAWSDRKSTRLNSSHQIISYAVFCLKKSGKGYALLYGGDVLLCGVWKRGG